MIFWKIGNNNIEETKKLIRTVDPKSKKKNELREEFKDETEGLYLFSEFTNSMLYTYSMLLQVSLPMLPRVFAVRILIGWWWIYAILITCSYRASLTAALANPTLRYLDYFLLYTFFYIINFSFFRFQFFSYEHLIQKDINIIDH